LALFVKLESSDTRGSSRENKKRLKAKKLKPTNKCHTCYQKGHWSNNYSNVSNERKISKGFANLTINSLYLIGNHEVGIIMAVIGNMVFF